MSGLSIREEARRRGVSLYRVRRDRGEFGPGKYRPKLNITRTSRGLKATDSIRDDLGKAAQVLEASTERAPFLWLVVGDYDPATGMGRSDAAHLTLDQARELARQLVYLADHHYQEASA